MQNPISIRLSKSANEIMPDDITKESTPLDPGAIIGGKHYGFIIFNEMTNCQNAYPTQCRISAVGIENGVVKVMEEGKYNPWKFNLNGDLIEFATFCEFRKSDQQYLADHFEGHSKEDMQKANAYRKKKH